MHILCDIYTIDPSDYMAVDDSVTFEPQPDGQSSPQCTDITIINDELLEDDEMFTVEIQNPSLGVSPDPLASSATVIVTNDDGVSLMHNALTDIIIHHFFIIALSLVQL